MIRAEKKNQSYILMQKLQKSILIMVTMVTTPTCVGMHDIIGMVDISVIFQYRTLSIPNIDQKSNIVYPFTCVSQIYKTGRNTKQKVILKQIITVKWAKLMNRQTQTSPDVKRSTVDVSGSLCVCILRSGDLRENQRYSCERYIGQKTSTTFTFRCVNQMFAALLVSLNDLKLTLNLTFFRKIKNPTT